MKKRKMVNDTLKTVVSTVTILIFLTITGFYLFNLYINIDIQNEGIEAPYEVTKTSQTVADIKEEDKKIADVLEEVSSSVVGISKLQENGNSIFLQGRKHKTRLRNRCNSIRRRIHYNK